VHLSERDGSKVFAEPALLQEAQQNKREKRKKSESTNTRCDEDRNTRCDEDLIGRMLNTLNGVFDAQKVNVSVFT